MLGAGRALAMLNQLEAAAGRLFGMMFVAALGLAILEMVPSSVFGAGLDQIWLLMMLGGLWALGRYSWSRRGKPTIPLRPKPRRRVLPPAPVIGGHDVGQNIPGTDELPR